MCNSEALLPAYGNVPGSSHKISRSIGLLHTKNVRKQNYVVRCDYSPPAARALRRPRRALRLLVIWPHGLYINLAVRREYSSLGRSGSTSTTPYAAIRFLGVRLLRLLSRLVN
jgi:hypothetical protein